jgi:hypothetical protein
LTTAIATYRVGLDAEITLLTQVERLSTEQRDATAARDLSHLVEIAEERERLLASLVAIEREVRPIRHTLSTHRTRAATLSGFVEVVALHRQAERLVTEITSADEATLDVLRHAEQARRFAGQTVERGEATLAAYRRVVAPPPSGAALFSQRG